MGWSQRSVIGLEGNVHGVSLRSTIPLMIRGLRVKAELRLMVRIKVRATTRTTVNLKFRLKIRAEPQSEFKVSLGS